jgi:hypothetical protein
MFAKVRLFSKAVETLVAWSGISSDNMHPRLEFLHSIACLCHHPCKFVANNLWGFNKLMPSLVHFHISSTSQRDNALCNQFSWTSARHGNMFYLYFTGIVEPNRKH